MITVTVWLLVMTGSGSKGAVQPHLFPTVEACQQVASNIKKRDYIVWQCIQTQVLVQGGK